MIYAGVSLIIAGPRRLGDLLRYVEGTLGPQIESQHGSLGTSLHANSRLGSAVLASFWASDDALRVGEPGITEGREQAARLAGGSVTVEHYAVPVFEQEASTRAGAAVRLTRIDIPPSQVEDAVEVFGDTAVPWLAETEGASSVLYFVDYGSGRSVSETVWPDPAALEASQGSADLARAELVSAGCAVRAVQEYTVVYSSARKY
jgi:hypothetical protein